MTRPLIASALAALVLAGTGCGAMSGLSGVARLGSLKPSGLPGPAGLGAARPSAGAIPFAGARAGRNFDESRVKEIQKGRTSRADIEGWTGSANSQTRTMDSSGRTLTTCTYVFVSVRSRGPWRRSASLTKALTVRYDENSVAAEFFYNETAQ